jgi:hypothetical protein
MTVFALALTPALSGQQQPVAPGDLQNVRLIDSSRAIDLKYSVASRRGHTGIATGKQYFVFVGGRAAVRTSNRTPAFEFVTDPAFDEPIRLFRLDMQGNRREIRAAKGTGSLAEVSIPKDHIIQTNLAELGDGTNSTKRYRLTPATSLRPGEYCLGRNSYTCFDFGVD